MVKCGKKFYIFALYYIKISKQVEYFNRNIRVQSRFKGQDIDSERFKKATACRFGRWFCFKTIGISALFRALPDERMEFNDAKNESAKPIQ